MLRHRTALPVFSEGSTRAIGIYGRPKSGHGMESEVSPPGDSQNILPVGETDFSHNNILCAVDKRELDEIGWVINAT